ncbi:hypothetical protein [Streptomyces sp. NPDC054797]
MNRFLRNLLAIVTGVVAISTLAAVPAQAQTINSGSCGAGYYQQDAYPLGDNLGATGAGVLFLYYNSSTGKNCAILRRDESFIASGGMGVTLKSSGGGATSDGGSSYRSYAGPIYLYAPNQCVYLSGWITGVWSGSYAVGTHSGNSGWVHCG